MSSDLLARLEHDRSIGDWRSVAITLEALADEAKDDPMIAVPYLREMAAVYADQLGDLELAAQAYQRVIELDASDIAALTSLKAICRTTENWAQWVSIQEHLVDLESDVDTLAALLREFVVVREEALADDHLAERAKQRLRELGYSA